MSHCLSDKQTIHNHLKALFFSISTTSHSNAGYFLWSSFGVKHFRLSIDPPCGCVLLSHTIDHQCRGCFSWFADHCFNPTPMPRIHPAGRREKQSGIFIWMSVANRWWMSEPLVAYCRWGQGQCEGEMERSMLGCLQLNFKPQLTCVIRQCGHIKIAPEVMMNSCLQV